MKIEINNRQKLYKPSKQKIKRLTQYLIAQVARLDRSNKGWKDISIVLTDDAGIKLLNQKYLSKPDVTDVISFRYDPIPGEKGLFSGEIIVNVQRAVEEGRVKAPHKRAPRGGWNESKELALYIAHGCNHLTGETDYSRAERARMRRRELRWLKQAKELWGDP